jgi:hypothetical protein
MPSPTIVLIHGAFADASIWRPVFDQLNREGHAVPAPPAALAERSPRSFGSGVIAIGANSSSWTTPTSAPGLLQ